MISRGHHHLFASLSYINTKKRTMSFYNSACGFLKRGHLHKYEIFGFNASLNFKCELTSVPSCRRHLDFKTGGLRLLCESRGSRCGRRPHRTASHCPESSSLQMSLPDCWQRLQIIRPFIHYD